MHGHTLVVTEIPAKVFCKRFDCRFAGIIRSIAWRIGDALLAACDDNGRRGLPAASLEGRHVGIQAIYHTKKIGGENLTHILVSFHVQQGYASVTVADEVWGAHVVSRSPLTFATKVTHHTRSPVGGLYTPIQSRSPGLRVWGVN